MAKYLLNVNGREVEIYSDSEENAITHALKTNEDATLGNTKVVKTLKEK